MSSPPKQSDIDASTSSITNPHNKDEEILLFQGPPNKNPTVKQTRAKHDPEGILYLLCYIKPIFINMYFGIIIFIMNIFVL